MLSKSIRGVEECDAETRVAREHLEGTLQSVSSVVQGGTSGRIRAGSRRRGSSDVDREVMLGVGRKAGGTTVMQMHDQL